MKEQTCKDLKLSHPAIHSFAQKLESFSLTLRPREKRILHSILLEHLDPLDRMKWRDIRQLFTSDELKFLNNILAEESQ